MVSGSAPCSTEIVRFFHALNMPLLEAYGVSENVVPIALNTPDHGKIGTVGRPLSPKDVSFADDGEVLVRGWGISTGYLGLPAGEFTVDRDGWYHTGDLGQMDEDGYLVLIGRKADVAKLSNGRRVNLSSVEKSLWMMESVDEVVAFAHGRDYVTCAIVPSRIQSESPVHEEQLAAIAEVVADLQTDWPGFQKVRGLLVLPRPLSIEQEELTPNLKVRRRVIEQHHENKLGVLDALIRHDSSKNGESIPILHA